MWEPCFLLASCICNTYSSLHPLKARLVDNAQCFVINHMKLISAMVMGVLQAEAHDNVYHKGSCSHHICSRHLSLQDFQMRIKKRQTWKSSVRRIYHVGGGSEFGPWNHSMLNIHTLVPRSKFNLNRIHLGFSELESLPALYVNIGDTKILISTVYFVITVVNV
ncbi:unnamed protein product [Spodoptera exigua]|nr:unnamed protein product [Spodoptera exigua]